MIMLVCYNNNLHYDYVIVSFNNSLYCPYCFHYDCLSVLYINSLCYNNVSVPL